MRDDLLVMLSKAPVAGRVKTRLAEEIGPAAAARLQDAFIADLGERFAGTDFGRVLACAPSTRHPAFDSLATLGWERWEQGAGDLGARLDRALSRALRAGAQRVVFIGSDCPTLPVALVDRAFGALERAKVVVGPAMDGGYYLVGANALVPALFEDIPWGSEQVFASTVHRLEKARVTYEILPFWYDVDDLATLRRLAGHLGMRGPYGRFEAPRTQELLRALGM